MSLYYFLALVVLGVANLAFSIMILRGVAEEGIKVGFFEIRWQVHKHLKTYKEVCRKKTGKIGYPYYGYQGTLWLMILDILLLLTSLSP